MTTPAFPSPSGSSTASSRLGATNACFDAPKKSTISASRSLSLSPKGGAFIRHWKAFEGNLYSDIAGHCTIGYGHLVHHNACDGRSSEGAFKNGITCAQGAALFLTDSGDKVNAVRNSVGVELTQFEFDALVSFTYNFGGPAFTHSTLLVLVNSGQWTKIRAEFMKWVHAGGKISKGLINRRKAEADLFLLGIY